MSSLFKLALDKANIDDGLAQNVFEDYISSQFPLWIKDYQDHTLTTKLLTNPNLILGIMSECPCESEYLKELKFKGIIDFYYELDLRHNYYFQILFHGGYHIIAHMKSNLWEEEENHDLSIIDSKVPAHHNRFEMDISGLTKNNRETALESLKNMFIGLDFIEAQSKADMELSYVLFNKLSKEHFEWLRFVVFNKNTKQLIFSENFKFKMK